MLLCFQQTLCDPTQFSQPPLLEFAGQNRTKVVNILKAGRESEKTNFGREAKTGNSPVLSKVQIQVKMLVIQSSKALCEHMDCSLPGSAVRGILQARILEWFALIAQMVENLPIMWKTPF